MQETPRRLRRRYASILVLAVCIVALIAGTMVPGEWKLAIESTLFPHHFPASAFAHFTLFALAAVCLRRAPFVLRPVWVIAIALVAALATEGLQHFVIGRHPRLTDVGIDMLGALAGIALAARRLPGFKKTA